ncbi:TPA: DUF551 domain-containing protein [Enterobacter hormaechei subsp. xiangfangensis]|uniref:DUF551 domain-containing protein n=1 Tax=Enterobacter hormaechei TaxID=158836 RepID=UPI001889ADC8|nr:DUF551 domain-containing protein [Enterobacter hormaechei]MBF1951677.1 DUF551 domain-containing protein [Enterobacter hormaechei]HCM9382673.1 DUF551 domain-containing protein [Enterobacter hormaechei subsp. xiangfangensis]
MITLTKEWLQKTIAELEEERDAVPGVVNEDAAKALAAMKIALASLEADSKLSDFVASQESLGGEFEGVLTENIESLYVTSNPAVQITSMDLDEGFEKWYTGDACETNSIAPEWFSEALKPVFLETWRACRAAMLQGAEPVTTAYKLPDGWVACSERMPDIGTEIFYFCQDDGLRDCGIVSSSNFSGKGDAELYVHAEGYDLRFGVDISHWMPLPASPQQK